MSSDPHSGSPGIRRALVTSGVVVALLAALAILWRATDLGQYAQPRRLHEMLHVLGDGPWAVPVVWGVFVAAGLLMLPINALFAAVGLTFGFAKAVALSMSGALLSTLVVDWIGRRFDVDPLFERAPEWMRRLRRRGLEQASVTELAVMRLLPLGPFSTVNLIWGAAGVPRRRVLGATALGLTPGVLATSAIGEGLGLALEDPGVRSIAVVGAGVVALVILTWIGRRLLARRMGSDPGRGRHDRAGDDGTE